MALAGLVVGFVVLLIIGFPIAFCLLAGSIVYLFGFTVKPANR